MEVDGQRPTESALLANAPRKLMLLRINNQTKSSKSANVSSAGDALFAGGDDADADRGKGTNKLPDKNANSRNVSSGSDVGPSLGGGEVADVDSDCGKGTDELPNENSKFLNVSSAGDALFGGGDDADSGRGKGTNKLPNKNANSANVSSGGDVGPSSGGGEVANSGKGANERPDENANLANVSSGGDAGGKEDVPASERRGNCNSDSSDFEDDSGTGKYSYSDVEEPSIVN